MTRASELPGDPGRGTESRATWSADAPDAPSGVRLLGRESGAWKIVRFGERVFAALAPTADYYAVPSFEIDLGAPAGDDSWLIVTYLDRGYGLIMAEGTSGDAQDESGKVRLNTGKVRRAVFRLQTGACELRVRGVPWLASVTVTNHRPPREETPPHRPAFALKSPPELVVGSLAGAGNPGDTPGRLANLRNVLPLVRALGFNGVESYVQWNLVERTPGVFDWSAYDTVVEECERHGLGWFPLIIIGSAYSMPEWFRDSPDFAGFRCLEHGIDVDIPTIFHPGQVPYVKRFLAEFGKHYGSRKSLLGVRLGPSANYGEAQYPASGALGYRGQPLHTHLGYWAGDPYASEVFRAHLSKRYASIADLNRAWGGTEYASFDEVTTFLPNTARNDRMRADFSGWYMDAMSDWCEKWAQWAREALPITSMYQSSGGWGAVEIGTDYVAHTKSMAKLGGGIRLTNENDSFGNNFCVTQPAASAARFYGATYGTEPAGFGCKRGVMGRLFNIIVNNGSHLFYYAGNVLDSNGAVEAWVQHAPLLDQRAQPVNEIAAFYPDTANRLSDHIMRHLHASHLFTAAKAFRSVTDYDFAGEQMILDGALERYKVLVFLSGRFTEQAVLECLDRWIRAGGVAIYPPRDESRELPLASVEGDLTVWRRWRDGNTGKGRVIFYRSHPETVLYKEFLRDTLAALDVLTPATRDAIRMRKPEDTYWSLLSTGKLALLNYGDAPATVHLVSGRRLRLAPYTIRIVKR